MSHTDPHTKVCQEDNAAQNNSSVSKRSCNVKTSYIHKISLLKDTLMDVQSWTGGVLFKILFDVACSTV